MQPRNAALLLLLTAVAGQGVLRLRGGGGVAPGEVAFRIADTTSLGRHRAATSRPAEVGEGEMIDVDRAGAGELIRLPGVGPALARRIVDERTRNGPFGGPACLDTRVAGIGAGFLKRTGVHLSFSNGGCSSAPAEAPRSAPAGSGSGPGCRSPVSLNEATSADLSCLPGIGAARAATILTWRTQHGGFRSVEELRLVPGLPKRVVEGLLERVTTTPMP